MFYLLSEVLAPEDLSRVRSRLEGAPWTDGRATARGETRNVKHNEQAVSDNEDVQALETFVLEALRRHPVFEAAAQPRRVSRLLFSRTRTGGDYGAHVDQPLMGDPPLRSDLAFTLFLTPGNDYAGGALVIDTPTGEQAVRLAAGDAVLYPATTVHRVEPVTSGERLAAVGWVQSHVRDAARREILFDVARLRGSAPLDEASRLLLQKIQANLLRQWAEA